MYIGNYNFNWLCETSIKCIRKFPQAALKSPVWDSERPPGDLEKIAMHARWKQQSPSAWDGSWHFRPSSVFRPELAYPHSERRTDPEPLLPLGPRRPTPPAALSPSACPTRRGLAPRLSRPPPARRWPRWEKCFLVFFFRPKNTCFLVFFGQPVFFSAAGAFFFRGGRFIINITITLS